MRLLIALLVFLVFSACSTTPYVHKAGQFNRSSNDFGQTVTDISHVTICYNTYSTTPGEIRKLAFDECARFGKSIKFIEQDYNICPIMAPMAAFYACLGKKEIDESYNIQGISRGTLMNYDGIKFRY